MPDQDWFETTFRSAAAGALLLGADGRILRTNPSARELLGPWPDPVGRPLRELLPDRGDELESMRTQVQRDGGRRTISRAILESAARDRRLTVELEILPQSDSAGAVTGVLVLLNDRTGTERDTPEAARLFYEAFLHSTNAMELTDRDGYLLDVNPAIERIYGYSREEVIGRRPNVVSSGRTDRATYEKM